MEQYFKLPGLSWSFHYDAEMVFCLENCSDLLWEKKSFSGRDKLQQISEGCDRSCEMTITDKTLFSQWKVRTIFETDYIELVCY